MLLLVSKTHPLEFLLRLVPITFSCILIPSAINIPWNQNSHRISQPVHDACIPPRNKALVGLIRGCVYQGKTHACQKADRGCGHECFQAEPPKRSILCKVHHFILIRKYLRRRYRFLIRKIKDQSCINYQSRYPENPCYPDADPSK